jgi:hypothetical protein
MRKWKPKLAHLESPDERRRRHFQRAIVRFEQLSKELACAPRRAVVEAAGVLVAVDSRLSERERAMVELSLEGGAQARRVLEWFEPEGYPPRLHLLLEVCLGECERRDSEGTDVRDAA